jgi:hypothetical protein
MEVTTALVGTFISITGTIITLSTVRSQAGKQIGDLYDQMVKFRSDHPEVMYLSRQWRSGYFAKVYGEGEPPDAKWALYYSYVELCIGYCNAAILARRGFRIGYTCFKHYHAPLIKLILTEHYPIVDDMISGGGEYICLYIKRFRKKLEKDGWDWAVQHSKLAT